VHVNGKINYISVVNVRCIKKLCIVSDFLCNKR